MADVYLNAPCYVLGEEAIDHRDVPEVTARIAELGIPPQAGFWGWGTVHRSRRTLADLAGDAGLATLRAAGSPDVDALVLCSTNLPTDTAEQGLLVQDVLGKLGLPEADFTGVALNQCANLLTGVRAAEAAVAVGRHRRVLVVSTDRIEDERDRMQNFALFSDGAAGCLVADAPSGPASFRVRGSATATRAAELGWGQEISSELGRRVNERLLGRLGLAVGDLDAVLHTNVFKPVVMLKELQAGFRSDQLDPAGIPRVGHCFAADPMINLADRIAAGRVRPGGHYLLASSVPGFRVGVLLHSLPAPPDVARPDAARPDAVRPDVVR
jgi:3-oxoacyl-[acyl-carrier-protein] synthase-3